jgi:hypothetical protein
MMRARPLLITIAAVLVILVCKYLLPRPIQFSAAVSVLAIILLALAILALFIWTLRHREIDRRVIFILVAVALAVPFFMQLRLPMKISPDVQKSFDILAALPPGAKVLASFDYDPPSAPELQPMADAFMKYAFEHDIKVIIMGLWPQGPQQAVQSVNAAFKENPELAKKIKYGVDYVNLGFQSGKEFVILRMGESFKSMFPTDNNHIPYDSLPLMKNIRNYSNIDLSINFSAGWPGTVEWVQIAVDRNHLKLTAGNTAVQAPQVYPYVNSGQLIGLIGGMTGAAEYEALTKKPGKAMTFLLSQTFSHVVLILFIIIGNVAYFRSRKEKK